MVLQQKVLGQVHLLSLRHHCIIWMVLLARHAFSDSQHAWGFVMGRLRSVKMGLKVCIRTLNFISWAWNCLETHFSVSESLDAWAHIQLYFSKVKWQAPTWQLFRRGRWRRKLRYLVIGSYFTLFSCQLLSWIRKYILQLNGKQF